VTGSLRYWELNGQVLASHLFLSTTKPISCLTQIKLETRRSRWAIWGLRDRLNDRIRALPRANTKHLEIRVLWRWRNKNLHPIQSH